MGYRIYRKSNGGSNHIGSVTGTRLSISSSSSEYYVTAVDIVGRESGRSSVSSNPKREQEKKKAEEEKKEMEEEKIAEEEQKEVKQKKEEEKNQEADEED